jgi:hypothetical protein
VVIHYNLSKSIILPFGIRNIFPDLLRMSFETVFNSTDDDDIGAATMMMMVMIIIWFKCCKYQYIGWFLIYVKKTKAKFLSWNGIFSTILVIHFRSLIFKVEVTGSLLHYDSIFLVNTIL